MNGEAYTGQYVRGKKCGKGRSISSQGSVYEGGFSDDKRHGAGTFRLITGKYYFYK